MEERRPRGIGKEVREEVDLLGSDGGDAAGKGSREDAEELPEVQVMNHVMRELLKNRKQAEPARCLHVRSTEDMDSPGGYAQATCMYLLHALPDRSGFLLGTNRTTKLP